MKLIGELWHPDVAILPIGDRFTMGPVGGDDCRPVRRRTAGDPDALQHLAGNRAGPVIFQASARADNGSQGLRDEPGRDDRDMRQGAEQAAPRVTIYHS